VRSTSEKSVLNPPERVVAFSHQRPDVRSVIPTVTAREQGECFMVHCFHLAQSQFSRRLD